MAWRIGKDPGFLSTFVYCGYTAGLSYTTSRKTLSIVKSDWFQEVFGTEVNIDVDTEEPDVGWTIREGKDKTEDLIVTKSDVKEWQLTSGAGLVAAGVGGELTGKGGMTLIGDDLLKPRDSMSEIMREKTNEWIGETWVTRLNDQMDGVIVVIMQRLHELDPVGYLQSLARDPNADQWTHFNLPLEAERKTLIMVPGRPFKKVRQKGELLHEERVNRPRLEALKRVMKVSFWGQYQQRPARMEGGMLQPSKIRLTNESPRRIITNRGLRPMLFADLAVTEKELEKDDPDYTAIGVGGKDREALLWLIHMTRGQWALDVVAQTIYRLARQFNAWELVVEKGMALNALMPYLDMIGSRLGRRVHAIGIPLPRTGDGKVGRARGFQSFLNSGTFWMPDHQPWAAPLYNEMASFPNGAHDDQVDVLSEMVLAYDDLHVGTPNKGTNEPAPIGPAGQVLVSGRDIEQHEKHPDREIERLIEAATRGELLY